ncbi:Hypothetical predicted protein [Cloeon dipterum]|uniref:furin n=1 Tax=Cloeon dipterum TaxID=197152 RepID=A0A8S1E5H9_9INSE|nr:Hypothetical predicted protein [Cloeon dipterum]
MESDAHSLNSGLICLLIPVVRPDKHNNNRGNGLDMNVQPAWQDGVTGKGVVVSILDDGIETTHPDLNRNYDPQASYDVNNHDDDPMPRYDVLDSNRHGTRCAGEVAAVANNSLCSVGIAYGASVGGVRMLDGDVTDAVEARSLSLNPQHIDIYSASWGPDDDGKTVDGPGELARRAFIEGVAKGRSGKGSIFVWASGNGGRDHDNCNCDGYTNSIWTLSISSATENGMVPWYSEACSSTLATTYSSGLANERQIVTTDLHHQCTTSHTGTSASAPLAAGICALALEANRRLTWRDMQHIVVRTARSENLHSADWRTNAVGRNVSHSFGYGLMDAAAMVKLARKWVTVPEQQRCEIIAKNAEKLIPAKSQVNIKLRVRECPGVNFLEHVQAKITLTASRRGDLQIHLTSPGGTRSTLLDRRRLDVSRAGFNRWPFMTVHSWGETPVGIWQLEIHNEGRYLGRAVLREWSLVLHGTTEPPDASSRKKTPLPTPVSPSSPRVRVGLPQKQPRKKNGNSNNPSKQGRKTTTFSPFPSLRPRVTAAPRAPPSGKPGRFPTRPPFISTTTATPRRQEIIYPELGGLQFSPQAPNLTFSRLLPTLNKGSYPFSSLTRPKESRQGPKESRQGPKESRQGPKIRPPENMYALRAGASLPTKGLDLREDPQQKNSPAAVKKANMSAWELILHGTEVSPDSNGGQLGTLDELDAKEVKPVSNNLKNRETPSLGNSSRLLPATVRPKQIVEEAVVGPAKLSPNLTNSAEGCIKSEANMCLECLDSYLEYQGQCLHECPMDTYMSLTNKGKPNCRDCHYSCYTCKGPLNDHCLSCHPDARLRKDGNCLLAALDPVVNEARWYFWLMVAFMANVAVVGVAAMLFLVTWCRASSTTAEYTGLQPPRKELHLSSKVHYLSSDED